MQSNLQRKLHVAIIMDGNGRWAKTRRLPRFSGHKAGVKAVRSVVEACPRYGIDMLTLYAFSCDNWKRPAAEVSLLMGLFRRYITCDLDDFVCNDIRLNFIGRRDRIPNDLVLKIEEAEALTANGEKLTLRIAIDYSARDEILKAAKTILECKTSDQESFSKQLSGTDKICDVDLLIRTSGEKRLSDFLLWECAYSELYFTDRHWPDFSSRDLEDALDDFSKRSRRFGGLLPLAASPTRQDTNPSLSESLVEAR